MYNKKFQKPRKRSQVRLKMHPWALNSTRELSTGAFETSMPPPWALNGHTWIRPVSSMGSVGPSMVALEFPMRAVSNLYGTFIIKNNENCFIENIKDC